MAIEPKLLDELVAGYQRPEDMLGENTRVQNRFDLNEGEAPLYSIQHRPPF